VEKKTFLDGLAKVALARLRRVKFRSLLLLLLHMLFKHV